MSDKKPAIIVDLDGTLCDASGRRHYVSGTKKNYEKFYKASVFDQPNKWCQEIVNRFKDTHTVLYVSGRPDNYKEITLMWLEKYGLPYQFPGMELHMRKTKDYRTDFIIKKEIYDAFIAPYYDVLFCLDDRKQVVDMWRKNGLVVLACDEGNF